MSEVVVRTCKYKLTNECLGTSSILHFKTGLNCCVKCASVKNIDYYNKNKDKIKEINKVKARETYQKNKALKQKVQNILELANEID